MHSAARLLHTISVLKPVGITHACSLGCVLRCAANLQAKGEDAEVVKAIDVHRAKFGLKALRETNFATLLEQQKEETVEALARVSCAQK
jgi:hypothetical protein